MALINPAQLNFSGEETRDLGEAVISAVFDKPELSEILTMVPGIVAKKQIAILGRLSKITKLDAGCGLGAMSNQIGMSNKFWNPAQTKIWIKECHKSFEESFFVYLKNKGKMVADLTTTDIAAFIIEMMSDASWEDLLRIVFFNDTTELNVIGGGRITDGVSTTDYTIIDGIWKQLFAIAAATPARRTVIAENAGASFVAQDTWTSSAKNIFRDMITAADYRLSGSPDKVIYATQSLVNKYADELENANVPMSFERIEGGYTALKRRDVTIIAMPFWDRTIRSDFSNGTKWYIPHRAILTTKKNIQVGMDDIGAYDDFDVFYDKMTETSNFKGAYKIDAKVIEDNMVQVAY